MIWLAPRRSLSPARGMRLFLNLMVVVCALLGIGTFYLAQYGAASYPALQKLTSVTGNVTWVRRGDYGADFQIEGDARHFKYSRNGGEWYRVTAEIENKSSGPVSILIDLNDELHPSLGDPFFQVRGISKNGAPIRSYEQVRTSWLEDYRWGYGALVLMFFLAALSYRIGLGFKDE